MSYAGKQDGGVRNKSAAPIQITAEQLIREASSRIDDKPFSTKAVFKISDPAELEAYKLRKRKEYEDGIRRNRMGVGVWIKYADFEEKLREYARARSVYERSLLLLPRIPALWLRYAEMEMKNKAVNHARNILDRAVSILPRLSQFWLKYTHMEEILKNISGCRLVFERWMAWKPEIQAWLSYIKFELRYNEVQRARDIFEKFVHCHNDPQSWIKYAKFESLQRDANNKSNRHAARTVYERATAIFEDDEASLLTILLAFAHFEQQSKETERARAIYSYAMANFTNYTNHPKLVAEYSLFEKKFGSRASIEAVLLEKRRKVYETELRLNQDKNPQSNSAPIAYNTYDTWFDYIRLEEDNADIEAIRNIYERAIADVPPINSGKKNWARYVYLWIYYAVFEELVPKDSDRTREIYRTALSVIPHKSAVPPFTFGKLWIMAAKFELRQKNVGAFRRIMGRAIGMCPKPSLFRTYIDLEMELRAFDRCRKLFEQYIKHNPDNSSVWTSYCDLEIALNDTDRARAIFELAIAHPTLDRPELVWKSYIDFELENINHDAVRSLYTRLLDKTHHIKVVEAFSKFEMSLIAQPHGDGVEDKVQLDRVRAIYSAAEEYAKSTSSASRNTDRVHILQAWRAFESRFGDSVSQEHIQAKMPTKVKTQKEVQDEDGDIEIEEQIDYIFPDDTKTKEFSFLKSVKAWKKDKDDANIN